MSAGAKKLLGGIVVAFLLFYLFTQPSQAASAVNTMFDLLQRAAEALITFLRNIF